MPLYEYAPVTTPGCALCCYGFERTQPLDEAPLTQCPACGQDVRRVLGAPAVISGQRHVLDERNIARHGFSQYRRVGKGHYEKITGQGPDSFAAPDMPDTGPGGPSRKR